VPTWNPQQYLKFAEERTRPCRDLAARVEAGSPRRIIDLGCGPGNSAEVLSARWPHAAITGLDSSAAMIETARAAFPQCEWRVGDIAEWAAADGRLDGERFDLVFSNAALQWVDDHAALFPQLLARVAEGGALAVQIPGNYAAPQGQLLREVGARFHLQVREWRSHEIDFYYDALAPHASRLDLWATDYLHVMPNVEAIVEWYKGTGLRPYLDALPGEAERERFQAAYLEGLRPIYPPQANGAVLFLFRRIFIVAYP
jgi:trans-aconitate 2-methyltransferase